MSSSKGNSKTASDDNNEKEREKFAVKVSKGQVQSLDNVLQVMEALRSQEPDQLQNLELWAELMNDFSYTVGDLVESPPIMGIANRCQKMDFKHAAEVLMWTVQAASDENYDNSRRPPKNHVITLHM